MGLVACSFHGMHAMGGTIPVTSDSGGFNFTLTASSDVLTITYTDVTLSTINGISPVGGPISGTFSPATVNVISSNPAPPSSGGLTTYVVSEPGAGATKFFGTTMVAETTNQVATGFSYGGILGLNGVISSVVSPFLETSGTSPIIYDFSPFATQGAKILLSYIAVNSNFADTIANNGTISGTGSFSEIVPEPTSMTLLGIGMASVLAFRRRLARPVVS